jgi:hypothetical protein
MEPMSANPPCIRARALRAAVAIVATPPTGAAGAAASRRRRFPRVHDPYPDLEGSFGRFVVLATSLAEEGQTDQPEERREHPKSTYVNPKDVLIDSDPRIVAARKRWSDCMHEAEYEYEADQDEIIEEYQERLAELTEGDDPRTLTGARASALRKLQAEEIKVSLRDLHCQIKHTDRV